MAKMMYKGAECGGIFDNLEVSTGSNYIILGDVMILWGQVSVTSKPDARYSESNFDNFTFPKEFKSAPTMFLGRMDDGNVVGEYATVLPVDGLNFKAAAGNYKASNPGTMRIDWVAIGEPK